MAVSRPDWGEAVKAVVSFMPGLSVSEAELIDFCKEHLAGYEKPKSVDIVDELPKNNYGKIVKKNLRAPYWDDEKRKI